MGNRSIVLHATDKSRIACANLKLVNKEGGGASAGPTGGVSGSSTNGTSDATRPTATPTATPTGGAGMVAWNAFGLVGVLTVGAALM